MCADGDESGDEENGLSRHRHQAMSNYSSPSRPASALAPSPTVGARSQSISDNLLATGRRSSTYQYRTRTARDTSGERVDNDNQQQQQQDSSAWSQYLRQKYGQTRTGSVSSAASGGPGQKDTSIGRSKSSNAIYDQSSDSDSDDRDASGRSPSAMSAGQVQAPTTPASNLAFNFPRSL